ncbi:MAG: prepilin-type N-terminal cleavage/methylation domain-containing protein [Planctomycetota bacterium]
MGALKGRPIHAFTLLEMIVALAIMAAGLVFLGNVVTGSIGQAGFARDERIGAMLADQKMGQILAAKDLEIELHSGTFEGYDGYDWSFEHSNKSLKITKPPDNKEEEQGQFAEVILQVRIPGRDKAIKVVAHKPVEPEQPAQGQGQGR